VQPDGASGIALKQQFVERFPTLLTDIEQDGSIADELTDILHPDVNGAASEVVAGGHATHGSVHLGRPIATVDDDGVAASLFSCDSIRLWNLIRKFVPKIAIVYE
jgi:hypothetical protein